MGDPIRGSTSAPPAPAPANTAAPAPVAPNTVAPPAPPPAAAKADDFQGGSKGTTTFLGQVQTKLVTFAQDEIWKQVEQKRTVDLASLKLPTSIPGANASLGIQAYEQVIDPKAAKADPARGLYEAQHPEPHLWVQTGGIMQLGAGLNIPIQLSAANVTASLGFNASGAIDYAVAAPYAAQAGAPLQLAKNLTLDLPLTSSNALQMVPGQEFAASGQGNLGASARVGAGTSYGVGPFSLGVSGGISGSIAASGRITVNVKRLDGGKVYVEVSRDVSKSAQAGVDVTAGLSLSAGTNKSITNAEKFIPSNAITNLVTGQVNDTLKSEVKDYLTAKISADVQTSSNKQRVASFVIDLSKGDAAKAAYDSLIRLDMGPARAASAADGVSPVFYDEADFDKDRDFDAKVGPWNLFLRDHAVENKVGVLDGSAGDVAVRDSTFKDTTDSIFGGKGSVTWEGFNYRPMSKTTIDPNGQTLYHLSYTEDARMGSGDVQDVKGFAEIAGAPLNPDIEKPLSFFARIWNLSRYGHATTNADVYFDEPGLQKVANASRAQLIDAFVRSAQAVEGAAKPPAWADPVHGQQAMALLQSWEREPVSGKDNKKQQLALQYRQAYGREASQDLHDYQHAQVFANTMSALAGKPARQWTQAFAKLGNESGFHIWKMLGAVSLLAGKDHTFVDRLSVKSDKGGALDILASHTAAVPGVNAAEAAGKIQGAVRGSDVGSVITP